MSNRIKLTRDEFTIFFNEKCLPFLRVTSDDVGFSPYDTKEERLEKVRRACNPSLPREIVMHTSDGSFIYHCD